MKLIESQLFDDSLWETTKKVGTIDAYEAYIGSESPQAYRKAKALDRIRELVALADIELAMSVRKTKRVYIEVLQEYEFCGKTWEVLEKAQEHIVMVDSAPAPVSGLTDVQDFGDFKRWAAEVASAGRLQVVESPNELTAVLSIVINGKSISGNYSGSDDAAISVEAGYYVEANTRLRIGNSEFEELSQKNTGLPRMVADVAIPDCSRGFTPIFPEPRYQFLEPMAGNFERPPYPPISDLVNVLTSGYGPGFCKSLKERVLATSNLVRSTITQTICPISQD